MKEIRSLALDIEPLHDAEPAPAQAAASEDAAEAEVDPFADYAVLDEEAPVDAASDAAEAILGDEFATTTDKE